MYYKLLKLKNRVYDAAKIDWDHMMFDRSAIWKLLIPLMIENLLASFMGMADSMMVTRIGSAAISAVSLTDSINNLVIQLFSAMATGGTILCSQYIGSGDPKKANAAARQVVLSMTSIAIVISLFSEALNTQILRLVFGSVEPAVLSAAETYFRFTAASFPFLGLYQIGAAFYRAGGNSRFPMRVSVISNVMNIIGNAIFIFGFGWGVAGAAFSTLLSRILAAIILFVFLRKPKQVIVLRDYRIRPDFDMIARILAIGIPSGIENSMFQFGKLAIQSSVSTLGTTAIAAQAMAIIFENINGIRGRHRPHDDGGSATRCRAEGGGEVLHRPPHGYLELDHHHLLCHHLRRLQAGDVARRDGAGGREDLLRYGHLHHDLENLRLGTEFSSFLWTTRRR